MYEIWVLEEHSKLKKIIRVRDEEERDLIIEHLKHCGYGYNVVRLEGGGGHESAFKC